MSSVRKRNQTPHKFTTLDIILDMYDYTSQIISNDKVFDRTYKSLIDRIDNEASMIYHLCRTANEDYDNRNEEEVQIRLKLEEEAIDVRIIMEKQMKSIITKFRNTIAERKDIENAIAEAEEMKAIYDYNIMMGNIEDPQEDEDGTFTEI